MIYGRKTDYVTSRVEGEPLYSTPTTPRGFPTPPFNPHMQHSARLGSLAACYLHIVQVIERSTGIEIIYFFARKDAMVSWPSRSSTSREIARPW